jgi:hypothetical protein
MRGDMRCSPAKAVEPQQSTSGVDLLEEMSASWMRSPEREECDKRRGRRNATASADREQPAVWGKAIDLCMPADPACSDGTDESAHFR